MTDYIASVQQALEEIHRATRNLSERMASDYVRRKPFESSLIEYLHDLKSIDALASKSWILSELNLDEEPFEKE